MKSKPGKTPLRVCILSPHPLVLAEFSRALAPPHFQTVTRQLDSMLGPELRKLAVAAGAGIRGGRAWLGERHGGPDVQPAGEIALGARPDRWRRSSAEPKATICFGWAPKDSELHGGARTTSPRTAPGRQRRLLGAARHAFGIRRLDYHQFPWPALKVERPDGVEQREQEVLDSLLENLANKEIASRFNISERTVKFHVSNLLSKFGVRRRADLILLCYQRRSKPPKRDSKNTIPGAEF